MTASGCGRDGHGPVRDDGRPVLDGRQVRIRPGVPGDAARLRDILSEPSVSQWWGEPDPVATLEGLGQEFHRLVDELTAA